MDLWWHLVTAEDLELNDREYVCETCNLVHWVGSDACEEE